MNAWSRSNSALTILICALISLTAVFLPARSAVAANEGSAAPTPALRQASDLARTSGQPVLAEVSHTSLTHAMPDGSFTKRISFEAERAQDRDGNWRTIDTSLARQGSMLGARTPGNTVNLSAGGRGALARIASSLPVRSAANGDGCLQGVGAPGVQGGANVALRADLGALPKPRVAGSTATYRNYRPNQTLAVSATPYGFRAKFILKRRPAGNASFALKLKDSGLNLKRQPGRTGGIDLVRDGRTVGFISVPTVGSHKTHKRSGDALFITTSQLGLKRVNSKLSKLNFTIPAAYLQQKKLSYPVNVSIEAGIGMSAATYLYERFPTKNFIGDSDTKVGSFTTDFPNDSVAYYCMPGATIPQARITHAQFYAWNDWSGKCGAGTMYVKPIAAQWNINNVDWNSQKPYRNAVAKTETSHGGNDKSGHCPAAYLPDNQGISVIRAVQDWADGTPNYGLAFMVPDAKNIIEYKRFLKDGDHPTHIDVSYYYVPGKPSAPTVAPRDQFGQVPIHTPTLTSVAPAYPGSDPLQMQFTEVGGPGPVTFSVPSGSGQTSSGVSPALGDDHYTATAAMVVPGKVVGPSSDGTYFEVDTRPDVDALLPKPHRGNAQPVFTQLSQPQLGVELIETTPGEQFSVVFEVYQVMPDQTEKLITRSAPIATGQTPGLWWQVNVPLLDRVLYDWAAFITDSEITNFRQGGMRFVVDIQQACANQPQADFHAFACISVRRKGRS